jgi:hypothetical protein
MSPILRGLQSVEKANEVRDCMGVRPSRERVVAFLAAKNPGVQTARPACDRAEKAREGMRGCVSTIPLPEARNLGAGKAQGGNRRLGTWPNTSPNGGLCQVCESLEGRPLLLSRGKTPEGHGAREGVRHLVRIKASKGQTP